MAGSILLGSSVLFSLSILYLSAGRGVIAADVCPDPQPPEYVRAKSLSSTTFSLTWSADDTNTVHCMVGFRVCLHRPSGDTPCNFLDCRSLGGCGGVVSWSSEESPLSTVACAEHTATVAVVSDYLGVDGRISRALSAAFQAAPAGVKALQAVETTANWTRLSWEASSSPWCVDHYIVSWCSVQYPWSTTCSPQYCQLAADLTSYNITDLTPCTTYHVSVTAVSGTFGPMTDANLTVTTSTSGAMAEVQHLSLQVSGDEVSVYWRANPEERVCVSGYEVCWWSEGGNENCTDDVPYAELDLEFCTRYNVSVRAVGVTNTTSEPVVQQVSTGTGEVMNLTVLEVSANSAVVSWEPAPFSDVCGSGYVLAWCADPPCEPSDAYNLTLDTTSYNVTGLLPCLPHLVAVRTVSDDGSESIPSTIVAHTLLREVVPPRVTHVDVVSSTVTVVSFSPAAGSRDCISDYMGCLWEQDEPGAEPVCLTAPNKQYWTTWDNHTRACTNYTLQLTALATDGRNATTTLSFTSGAGDVEGVRAYNVTSNSTCYSSARLEWTVMSGDECVDGQVVSWSRADGHGLNSQLEVPRGAREVVLEDMDPCVQYEVAVVQRATTSSTPTVYTFYTASNVRNVTDLKTYCAQEGTLNRVSFVVPNCSRSCVAYYSVCWGPLAPAHGDNASSSGDHWTCQTLSGSGTLSTALGGAELFGTLGVSVTPVATDGREYDGLTMSFTACSSCARLSAVRDTLLGLLALSYLLSRLQPCSSS